MFCGLGSDGTAGADKSAVRRIAWNTELYVQAHSVHDARYTAGNTEVYGQAYFEYDTKNGGSVAIDCPGSDPQPNTRALRRALGRLPDHPQGGHAQRRDTSRGLGHGGACVVNRTCCEAGLEAERPARMRRV